MNARKAGFLRKGLPKAALLSAWLAALPVLAATGPALALDGVVASIKPVHSLVSAVMEGVGEPALVVRGAGSEHVHSLRPSDAQALEGASVVFWIGGDMETFLRNPLETLAAGATVVALEDAPGLVKLDYREGGPFEAHDHGDDDHDHDHSHGHAHDDDAHDDHGHAHGRHDLHFWLDPLNARAMVAHIEHTLAEADPDNAARYRENVEAYSQRLDALVGEIEQQVAPVRDRPAIVFHDAYQYFENRFGIDVAGSITVSPEAIPGAQRIAEISARVRELGAVCIFSEPQFEPRLASLIAADTGARTGVLDPLGAGLRDGPELYFELIRSMATSLTACLSEEG